MPTTFLALAISSSRRTASQLSLTKNPYQSLFGVSINSLRRSFHHTSLRPSQLQYNKSAGKCQPFGTSLLQDLGLLHRKTISSRILVLRTSSTDFCPPKTAERLRLRDGIPKSYTLIYRSDFSNYLLLAQTVVFVTVVITITGFAVWLGSKEKTAEVLEEHKRLQREDYAQWKRENEESRTAVALKELREKYGGEEPFPSKPELGDIAEEGGPVEIAILTICTLFFIAAIFRIMRITPVRIYMNEKTNHCVAVLYGHLVPGKLTYHEFIAGTVRKAKSRVEFYSNGLYKDGSGNRLVMMEHFFRNPSDYNYLLGIQEEFMAEAVKQRVRANPSRDKEDH